MRLLLASTLSQYSFSTTMLVMLQSPCRLTRTASNGNSTNLTHSMRSSCPTSTSSVPVCHPWRKELSDMLSRVRKNIARISTDIEKAEEKLRKLQKMVTNADSKLGSPIILHLVAESKYNYVLLLYSPTLLFAVYETFRRATMSVSSLSDACIYSDAENQNWWIVQL